MATLKDISKQTGFSVTTVSRALNGYDDVNENTRDIIIKTAQELNYSPNILARSLVTKQSKTIGFLVSDLVIESAKDSFMFNTLCGVSDALSATEYEFVLLSTTISKRRNKTYSQLCVERQLDGVIIQGVKMEDPYLQEVIEGDIPCVVIDTPTTGKNVGSITSNQVESATNAVKYLCRMNHCHIAFVNGASHAHVSKMRRLGYEKALSEEGIEIREHYIVDADFSEEKAKQAIIPILLNNPEITAVFCASDVMALGVLQAANELSINVPNQLSIIGFDNILLSQYVTPPLTTIGQSPYKLGVNAVDMVINFIEGNEYPDLVEIKNELVIRESVAFREQNKHT